MVTQLKAIKSSIEKTIAIITTKNLLNQIEAEHNIEIKEFDDEIDLIVKSI